MSQRQLKLYKKTARGSYSCVQCHEPIIAGEKYYGWMRGGKFATQHHHHGPPTLSTLKFPFQLVSRKAAFSINEKNDCTVRALSTVFGVDYLVAHQFMEDCGRLPGTGFSPYNSYPRFKHNNLTLKPTFTAIWDKDFAKMKEPTLNQALVKYNSGRHIFSISDHVFAVIDGVVHDSFAPSPRKAVGIIYTVVSA